MLIFIQKELHRYYFRELISQFLNVAGNAFRLSFICKGKCSTYRTSCLTAWAFGALAPKVSFC